MFMTSMRRELRRRLRRPQRHRLLHGYPMRSLMSRIAASDEVEVAIDPARPLLVGVLPHPFCNPRRRGCGFCTFPHETPRGKEPIALTTAAVGQEIAARLEASPELANKPVVGVYFGGGTANLTPPDAFAELCQSVAAAFDTRSAEVTLEGVPRYFLLHDGALLTLLGEALPSRHQRISVGVQTFDEERLRLMGRQGFGGRDDTAKVIEVAHAQGMTASVDLLINLPGQSAEEVLADIRQADDLGVDQICIYHLVLYEGLGTEWSEDEELLAALPSNAAAFETWRRARDELLSRGFEQRTLTNFERASVARSARAFTYEAASFRADQVDAVGFGPGGISTFTSPRLESGVKLVNGAGADDYRAAVARDGRAWALRFDYDDEADRRLLFITRSLALLGVSRPAYRWLFGGDIDRHFGRELQALLKEKLVRVDSARLELTEKGMFYADSVAGLFASQRSWSLSLHRSTVGDVDEETLASHMG